MNMLQAKSTKASAAKAKPDGSTSDASRAKGDKKLKK